MGYQSSKRQRITKNTQLIMRQLCQCSSRTPSAHTNTHYTHCKRWCKNNAEDWTRKKKNKKYENEKCARRMYSSECFQSQIAECSLVGLQWVYLCLWVTCFVILFLIFVLPVIRCCWSSTFCCCCSSFAYSCVSSFFPALFAPFLC